jgi:ribose transport system ATP-binding protein
MPAEDGGTATPPLVEVRSVSKSFQGQQALKGVSLTLHRGRVKALIGHNGSGKSTLIKVLSGFHLPDPDDGSVWVDEVRLRLGDPVASARLGLRFIHQDLGLLDQLTVVENLKLGGGSYASREVGPIRWRTERREAARLLGSYDIRISPSALMSSASPVQRTEIAIVRALQDEENVRVLVLDEPTATLPDAEVAKLFRTIRIAVRRGISVLYVSHRLEELYEIADDFLVLRDGQVVGEGTPASIDRAHLIELITGSAPVATRSTRLTSAAGSNEPSSESARLLRLEGVAAGHLRRLNLDVRAGEIVGLAGLAGSGVHDLPELLVGRIPVSAGSISVDGQVWAKADPVVALLHRVAVLPGAKQLKSIGSMNVRENVTLPSISRFWRKGFFRYADERREVSDLLVDYAILPRSTERGFSTLSGGNQQKACVAKWMRTKPKLLVLDEPTAGVDVGGRLEILRLIRQAADDGVGVLICSSDLEDLADICERVIIVRQGVDDGELAGDEVKREIITAKCY